MADKSFTAVKRYTSSCFTSDKVYQFENCDLLSLSFWFCNFKSLPPKSINQGPRSTDHRPRLRPHPFNQAQIWQRNALSNPGPRSTIHFPWLLAKLLARIGRLTYTLILLRYCIAWKSEQKWCPGASSTPSSGKFKYKNPLFSQFMRLTQQTKAQSLSTTLSTAKDHGPWTTDRGYWSRFLISIGVYWRGGATGAGGGPWIAAVLRWSI